MRKSIFATAINCMDGRVQLPVIEYLKNEFNVDYVDMITEPGPNKILAEGRENFLLIQSIKKRVLISVEKHNSGIIAIVGHHDCAGNPTNDEIQKSHIVLAMKALKQWNFEAKIIGLWVDENWQVQLIK